MSTPLPPITDAGAPASQAAPAPESRAPAGPTPLELLRALPAIRAFAPGYLLRAAQRYGDLVRFQAGRTQAFFLNHPDLIRTVLQDHHTAYTKATIQYRSLARITGQGLLTSDGAFWLRQRRMAQPAFARPTLSQHIPAIRQAGERLLERWDALPEGATVDIGQEMLSVSLDIVGQALFGADLGAQAHAILHATIEALDHLVRRLQRGTFWLDGIPFLPANRKFAHALKVLDDAAATLLALAPAPAADRPRNLLDQLREARDRETGQGMTPAQLRDEIVTLLIAGHETVASALTWTWYLLAVNPHASACLEAEVRRPGESGDLDQAALDRLPFARQTFLEGLRLYPPAWIITRAAAQDEWIGGCAVPAGALILISPYTLHRHPALWEDPEQFRPERFANLPNPGLREGYIPFGAGPRLCIGNHFALLEAHLLIAQIARRYRLELDPQPSTPPAAEALVTLRPAQPLMLRLRRIAIV